MIGYYLMSADAAEEFFKRSLHKEAVTEAEKVAILNQMETEGLILARGSTDGTQEELADKVSKIANVIVIKSPNKRKPGFNNAD